MLSYVGRILLSLLLSGIIGWDREKNEKNAGMRTVMLVCLGATVFTIISLYLKTQQGDRYDFGRIIAYIIVGIGFLGSGVINQYKGNVDGTTTASVLWAVVSIGILCGLGLEVLAIVTALCIYAILKSKYIIYRGEIFIKSKKDKK